LATIVVTVGLVLVVSEALGAVGWFTRWALVGATALAGVGLDATMGRRGGGPPVPRPVPDHSVSPLVAIAGLGVVAAQWAARFAGVARGGIDVFDSQWYHLPVAARFAQTGWLTHPHHISPDFPVSWHQSSSEVLHGIGMLLLGSDVLSLWLFLAFAGVVVLAAWCIGRPFGAAPLCVLASSVILGSTLVGLGNVAGGYSDLPATAWVLAAAALLLQSPRTGGSVALAGAAAGLALSTKITVLTLVAGLTIVVVATAIRGERTRTALCWAGAVALTGSYWFVRNLVHADNPIPGVDLAIGPVTFPGGAYSIPERYGFSVADYLFDGRVWSDYFVPGLTVDLGPAWWLTLGLLAVALIATVARGRPVRSLAGIGAVLAAGVASYVIAPTTALGEPGEPLLFASNVRYLMPTLVLALAVLPVGLRPPRGLSAGALALALGVALVAAQLDNGDPTYPAWPEEHRAVGVAAGAVLVALGGAAYVGRGRLRERWSRARGPHLLAAAALLLLALSTASWTFTEGYLDARYRDDPIDRWAQAQRDQRIAVADVSLTYPLLGRDLSNHVQWVGDVGEHGAFRRATSCTAWRRALREGRYGFVIVGRAPTGPTPEPAWTASDPAAAELLVTPSRALYAFDPRVTDPGCPPS
jgi:hypothetical protein